MCTTAKRTEELVHIVHIVHCVLCAAYRGRLSASGAVNYSYFPQANQSLIASGNATSGSFWFTSAVNLSAAPSDLGSYFCSFTAYSAVNTTVYLFGALLSALLSCTHTHTHYIYIYIYTYEYIQYILEESLKDSIGYNLYFMRASLTIHGNFKFHF